VVLVKWPFGFTEMANLGVLFGPDPRYSVHANTLTRHRISTFWRNSPGVKKVSISPEDGAEHGIGAGPVLYSPISKRHGASAHLSW